MAPPVPPFPHPPTPGILASSGSFHYLLRNKPMADRETTLLSGRVTRIQQILGRQLQAGASTEEPLPHEDGLYLRETAEEFYWNDLEWEKLTGEEQVDDQFLTQLAFPGFLTFIRGLLLEEVQPDSVAPPQPRPEVVWDVLGFLAKRVVELEEETACCEGEAREHREAELQMTSQLVDLVLHRLFRLNTEEVSRVEAALASD